MKHTERIARAADVVRRGAAVADAFQCRLNSVILHGAFIESVGITVKLCTAAAEPFAKKGGIGAGEIAYRKHAAQIKPVHCLLTDKKQTFNRKRKDFFLKTVFRDDRGCIRFFHI